MRRAFTTREKVLIVILALLLIGIGYFKLILEPIDDAVDDYNMRISEDEDAIMANTTKLTKMRAMQKELEEIYASGDAKPLPDYDNADKLLIELNTILSRASEVSMNFPSTYTLEDSSYIVTRPLTLTFKAESYTLARSIVNALHDSANINQISDLFITFGEDSYVTVTLTIRFFELIAS